MVRANQGGSILGFLIIGGALALLFVGGAYFVRNNLMPAEPEPEVALQEDDDADNGNGTETEDTEQPSENQPESEQPKEEDQPVETEETPEPEPEFTPVGPQSPAEESLPETGNDEGEKIASEGPSSLPQTGPADVLIGSLMLGGLAAVVVRYIRSR